MRVRKMSPGDPDTEGARDMMFGHGQADFYRDQPEAVAQAAETRLMLFKGEWAGDLRSGTPWNTEVLGKYTGPTRDPVIQSRLLGTPNLTEITAYSSTLDRETRRFTVAATVETAYGSVQISIPSPL